MRYGYARVSTVRQQKDGNSLEDQRRRLLAAGAEQIIEDSYTGARLERPGFTQLIDKLQAGDTLIVTKLDRFARTAAEGSMLVKEFVERGVLVNILNIGPVENNITGNLMIMVMLAFAEYERDMIIERTQMGREIARKNGVKVDGRPKKFTPKQLDHAMELLEGHSFNQVVEMTGISRSTLIRQRNAQKAKIVLS